MHRLFRTSVLAFLFTALPMAIAAQQEEPQDARQEPQDARQKNPQEEATARDESAAASEAEVERIEEALDDLEDRLDELQESVEDGASEVDVMEVERDLRQRQRDMRQARDPVRRHLRGIFWRLYERAEVGFGSNVRLEEGQVGRDIVAIGGSVFVGGEAHGDAVAIGGKVEVTGQVTGDVVAVGGGVVLGPDSEVLGQVTSVGPAVERAEGARVLGGINEIDLGDVFSLDLLDLLDWDWNGGRDRDWIRFGRAMDAMWGLTGILMLVLLASLILLVGSDTVERVRKKAIEAPWQSGLVGLAAQLCFLPVLIIVIVTLCISIIGIPLLIVVPFALLGFVIAFLVGYAGVALALGRWIEKRFGWRFESPFVALLVGVVFIQLFSLAGDFLGVIGSFIGIFALMLGLFGFFVKFLAWTVGLGAVLLAGLDRRSARRSENGGGTPAPSLPAYPGA